MRAARAGGDNAQNPPAHKKSQQLMLSWMPYFAPSCLRWEAITVRERVICVRVVSGAHLARLRKHKNVYSLQGPHMPPQSTAMQQALHQEPGAMCSWMFAYAQVAHKVG